MATVLRGRTEVAHPEGSTDPTSVAVRLRPPHRDGLEERFAATDPGPDGS